MFDKPTEILLQRINFPPAVGRLYHSLSGCGIIIADVQTKQSSTVPLRNPAAPTEPTATAATLPTAAGNSKKEPPGGLGGTVRSRAYQFPPKTVTTKLKISKPAGQSSIQRHPTSPASPEGIKRRGVQGHSLNRLCAQRRAKREIS